LGRGISSRKKIASTGSGYLPRIHLQPRKRGGEKRFSPKKREGGNETPAQQGGLITSRRKYPKEKGNLKKEGDFIYH